MTITGTDDWRERSAFQKTAPFEVSAEYIHRRFEGSGRMRKLNAWELDFARHVMALAGPEAAVLDVPCGSGRFYPIFRAARHVTMVDYNPSMLEVVGKTYEPDGRYDLVQGDISALPFADASFDLVFSMRLLHHIGDDALRRQILGQLSRVSRRYVALSLYSKHTLRYWRRRLLGKRPSANSVALGRFLDQAKQAGLRLLSKHPAVSFVEQQRMLLFQKVSP